MPSRLNLAKLGGMVRANAILPASPLATRNPHPSDVRIVHIKLALLAHAAEQPSGLGKSIRRTRSLTSRHPARPPKLGNDGSARIASKNQTHGGVREGARDVNELHRHHRFPELAGDDEEVQVAPLA